MSQDVTRMIHRVALMAFVPLLVLASYGCQSAQAPGT